MANFMLRVPTANFRSFFSVSASCNGAAPGSSSYSSQNGGPVILELPLDKIKRPLMRTRANDPNKVKELMNSIKEIGLQVPIDVLEVDGAYYGMQLLCYFLHLPKDSRDVIGTKHTSGSGFLRSAAKFGVGRKKH